MLFDIIKEALFAEVKKGGNFLLLLRINFGDNFIYWPGPGYISFFVKFILLSLRVQKAILKYNLFSANKLYVIIKYKLYKILIKS